ncbi:MAG: hypothetical protein JTT11_05355, partial [Candidatus Brockarchaeota archaeon]|nr:hypothetical protein [Candidatus Brockarchaeota archaeon]
AKASVESIRVDVSSGEVLIRGTIPGYVVAVDVGKIRLSAPMFDEMEGQQIGVEAAGNVTVYCRLFAICETRVGDVACFSAVYAARHAEGVAAPLFGDFVNEKVRVRDCAAWFSIASSLLVFMLSSLALRATWGRRLPVVTCTMAAIMYGLYVYAGTGLDILVAGRFSTPGVLSVLALGPFLHSSFQHLFNDFFLGFLPAGVAFESGLRWKSWVAMAKAYMASFFLVNLLMTAISYPMHGMPPMGSSYPVISLATVLVSLLFTFREKIVSDAAEKKASARLIALCGFGSYPLLRGVYDWLGYMIEYPTNWKVVGDGAAHLVVFAFTLFMAYSAREWLAKQEFILGI